jgi:hypothetical protein
MVDEAALRQVFSEYIDGNYRMFGGLPILSLRLLFRPALRALARPVSPPERLPLL